MIDDREVSAAADDRLGHDQVAAQLENLVRNVKTPANIALYGPWGSGKSGIANLLDERLRVPGQSVKFARFDAFKFAETPLRRNFVSAVATELRVTKDKYHDDLYRSRTETRYEIPFRKGLGLVGTFAMMLLLVAALLAVVAALLALAQRGDWTDQFAHNARSFVAAGFPFAAFLTAIAVLAGKQLGVERKTDKAESDEQFERLFKELVEDTKADKVVVFVDEIDRCEPKEVVATLDAIRTFLGVPKCVFVVATDQQVLEQALKQDVRQETPFDTVNPYYSAGSAYLDKVFQYQVSVPPLLPQSVTGFALELVNGRQGLWQTLDREYIVSVLIPSHVRSPRRVKHLLNAFAIAYRLAESRQGAGLLRVGLTARADELARLVCLQVEFPLFARDLVLDPLLARYVQRLEEAREQVEEWSKEDEHVEDEEPPSLDDAWVDYPFATAQVRALAMRYADCLTAVDEVLTDDDDRDRKRQVQRSQGKQLLDYLSRTRRVNGPGRDLIHLQSSGTAFGLDALLAERIESAAQNGRIAQVRREVEPVVDKSAAVSLLVQQMRTALGVEERNIASVLLALIADGAIDIASQADSVLSALARPLASNEDLLEADTLGGAWRLSTQSEREAATDLRQRVLHSGILWDDVEQASVVLADPDHSLNADSTKVGELLVEHLLDHNGVALVNALRGLTGEQVVRLLDAASTLPRILQAIFEDEEVAQSAEGATAPSAANSATTRSASATSTATGDDDPPRLPRPGRARFAEPSRLALTTWIQQLSDHDDKSALRALLTRLCEADHQSARNLIEPALATAAPWTDPSQVVAVLSNARRRVHRLWPAWLDVVHVKTVAENGLLDAFGSVAQGLWRQEDNPEAETVAAAAAFVRVVEGLPDEQRAAIQAVALTGFVGPVTDDDSADARKRLLPRVATLVGAGVLDSAATTTAEAESLVTTLGEAFNEPFDTADPVLSYVHESIERLLGGWGTGHVAVAAIREAGLPFALDSATWIPEPSRTLLRLRLRGAVHSGQGAALEDECNYPTLADIQLVMGQHPTATRDVAAHWLRLGGHSHEEVTDLLDRLESGGYWTDPAIIEAVDVARRSMSNTEALRLCRTWILRRTPPPRPLIAALGFQQIGVEQALDMLVERYSSSTTNEQRRLVFDLLEQIPIHPDNARRRVILELVLPQFTKGTIATQLGLDVLRRLQDVPQGMRREVQQAVVQATQGNEALEKRALATLEAAGYRIERQGWFGKRRVKDLSED